MLLMLLMMKPVHCQFLLGFDGPGRPLPGRQLRSGIHRSILLHMHDDMITDRDDRPTRTISQSIEMVSISSQRDKE